MHPSSDLSRIPQFSDAAPIVPMHGLTSSKVTGNLPVSSTEAMSPGVLDRNESQEFVDWESNSSITAVSLQANNSGTELSDVIKDGFGIPGRIR